MHISLHILLWKFQYFIKLGTQLHGHKNQCWTEGRSSTAVAEDLRPTATVTVAEI